MTARSAQLPLDLRPAGYPWGIAAGRAVALGFFIPGLAYRYRNGMEVDVYAKERPQARVLSLPGKKPYAQFYTPEKTKAWEEHIGINAQRELRSIVLDGPNDLVLPISGCRVLAKLRFNIRKPVSYRAEVIHHVVKPDLDNLVKAVLDGLVQGGVLDDDDCITDLSVCKRYADGEHPLGVEIELTCLAI